MEKIITKKNELMDIIKEYDRIYLYGAGKVGTLLYYILQDMGCNIEGFITSDCIRREYHYLKKLVFNYEDISFSEDDLIIISALERDSKEIAQICAPNNYIRISSEFLERYMAGYKLQIENVLGYERIITCWMNERTAYGKFFENVSFEDKDFLNRLHMLLSGMDRESRALIIRCINDTKKLDGSSSEYLDIFTEAEKRQLIRVAECMKDIMRVSDNVWAFHGYLLPRNDFRVDIFVDKLGLAKVKELEHIRDKNIIDVGGYIGDSALVLSDYTDETVYVFEPVESNIMMIEQTRKLNNARISAVKAAVSDYNGKETMSMTGNGYTGGLEKLGNREYEDENITEVITLDQFVADQKIQVGLLKIHAEGIEQKVIKGAAKLLKEQAPVIIIEMYHTESDFFDLKPLIESINDNYTFSVYKPANGYICMGMKLICEVANDNYNLSVIQEKVK